MPNGTSRGKGSGGGGGKGGKGGGSGGKGGGSTGDSPQWDCHICGLPANFGWRLRCRGCEAIRRGKLHGTTTVAAAEVSTNKGNHPPSLAERQLKQAREEQRKQRLADEEEKRQLREALTRLRAEAEGRRNKGADEDEGDGECDADEADASPSVYSAWTEEERQKKLDETRGGLAYLVSKFGEDSDQASSAREEIAAIQRASRDAKPFKAHRSLLERKRERLREKQSRDETEISKIANDIDELEAKRKSLKAAMDERNKQITEIEGELAELVKKALAEGEAAGEAGRSEEEGGTVWSAQSASNALRAMASKPGIPPEFAALLDHVFKAAQALASATAPSRPSAGPTAVGGGEGSGQRSDGNQQQQPQHQRQPQHPAAAATPGTSQVAGTGGAADVAGGKGNLSGAAVGPLAPQGRWSKGAGGGVEEGSGLPQQRRQPQGDAMQVDAVGPGASQTTAGGAENRDDNSEEMVEEEPFSEVIDEGVVESISKLPMADQKKLKAALGARGGRRRPTTTEGNRDEETAGGRDRERSPRPTKGGSGQSDNQE